MPVGDPPGSGQGSKPSWHRAFRAGHGQRALGELGALDEPAVLLPVPPQRGHESERKLGLARVDRPADRSAEIGIVDRQPIEPTRLVRPGQVGCRRLGKGQVNDRVTSTHRILATVVPESLERERPDRLEHLEPDARPTRVALDQALIDQRRQLIQHIAGVGRRFDDQGGLLVVEAAIEHREVVQDTLELGSEEVVAPGDRARQGPLSIGHVARTRARQRQMREETIADGRQGQVRDARCGELHPERQTVEERADLVDDDAVGTGVPARSNRARTFREQPWTVRTQARDRVLLFTTDPQRCAAGHDDPRCLGCVEEIGDVTGRVKESLEVVEHEQHRPVGEIWSKALGGRASRTVVQTDRSGDGRPDVPGVLEIGQRHEPRPFAEAVRRPPCRLHREAGLADTARPRESDESSIGDEVVELVELCVAPDEARQSRRQVTDRRGSRPKGGKLR